MNRAIPVGNFIAIVSRASFCGVYFPFVALSASAGVLIIRLYAQIPEIIVYARVPLEHADQYLTVESGVLVECEASALADQNPVYDRASATSGIITID
jgi:hypothetical protein